MKKITDEKLRTSYITILGWMISDLNLSGNELIVYALIYGYCQDGKSTFKGSLNYIASLVNLSKRGVSNIIDKLIEKGLVSIEGKDEEGNSFYFAKRGGENISPVANSAQGGSKIFTLSERSLSPAPSLSKDNNNRDNNKKHTKVCKENLVLPYSSDQFVDTWNILIQQPKWRGKTAYALMLSLKDLAKYAEPFAIMLMENSIKNNWQGVVFPPKNGYGGTDAQYAEWLKRNPQEIVIPSETKDSGRWYKDHHLYGIEDFERNDPEMFGQLLPTMQDDLRMGKKMLVRNGLWEWPEDYPNYPIYE